MHISKRVTGIVSALVLAIGIVGLAEAYSAGGKVKVKLGGPHFNLNIVARARCALSQGVETVMLEGGCVMTVAYNSCQPTDNGDGTWTCECDGTIQSAKSDGANLSGPVQL
jgi:hypothetical protein